jgi:hypothetical protein
MKITRCISGKGSYAWSLGVGRILHLLIGVRSFPLLRNRHKIQDITRFKVPCNKIENFWESFRNLHFLLFPYLLTAGTFKCVKFYGVESIGTLFRVPKMYGIK